MLREQTLADGKHTLCANCATLARGRELSLARLKTARFSDAGARARAETQSTGNAVTKLIRERESHRQSTGGERACECASCANGGRRAHRAPRSIS